MPSPDRRRQLRAAQWLLLLLFTLIVVRHAWMMDDAYITLRTVDNLFAGYGLVWNPGERVQSFTHPLWLLLLCGAHALSGEFFYATLGLGVVVSTLALALVVLRLARSQWVALTLLLVLTLSHAFVDYATSGLENPLTHLLVALFAWVYLGRHASARRFELLCLIGALSLLSRPDNAVLLGPAVIAAGVQAYRHGVKPRALVRAVLIGGIPLYAWELFSLVYYGSLVPNTALAKLRAGVPLGERIVQGLYYVLATIDLDPLTAVVIVMGAALPWLFGRRRLLPLGLGIALHLLYTISIGGDFMLGRFFTAPLFLAVVCLSQLRSPNLVVLGLVAAVLAALGLAAHPNTLEINSRMTPPVEMARTTRGVTDERTLLYEGNALVWTSRLYRPPPTRSWQRFSPSDTVEVAGVTGYRGFVGGPAVHWIDRTALSDPLLARLPAMYAADWMAGHMFRAVPKGYIETLETGENVIANANVAELYRRIDLVVHGQLWSRERFAAIWWLNFGGPATLIDEDHWRFGRSNELRPSWLAWRFDDDTPLDDKRARKIHENGAYLSFKRPRHASQLEISVNGYQSFELWFYDGDEIIARVPVPVRLVHGTDSLMARHIELPEQLRERGFTRVRILPRTAASRYVIGHLLFDEAIDSARPIAERPEKPKKADETPAPKAPRPQPKASAPAARSPDPAPGDR